MVCLAPSDPRNSHLFIFPFSFLHCQFPFRISPPDLPVHDATRYKTNRIGHGKARERKGLPWQPAQVIRKLPLLVDETGTSWRDSEADREFSQPTVSRLAHYPVNGTEPAKNPAILARIYTAPGLYRLTSF